jgi:hypothetical protein
VRILRRYEVADLQIAPMCTVLSACSRGDGLRAHAPLARSCDRHGAGLAARPSAASRLTQASRWISKAADPCATCNFPTPRGCQTDSPTSASCASTGSRPLAFAATVTRCHPSGPRRRRRFGQPRARSWALSHSNRPLRRLRALKSGKLAKLGRTTRRVGLPISLVTLGAQQDSMRRRY